MDIKDRVGPSLINFSTNILKNVRDRELWMLRSTLFHSTITEENKESLKKLILNNEKKNFIVVIVSGNLVIWGFMWNLAE